MTEVMKLEINVVQVSPVSLLVYFRMRTNSRAADGNTLTLHLFKLENMNIFLALFCVYLCIDGE